MKKNIFIFSFFFLTIFLVSCNKANYIPIDKLYDSQYENRLDDEAIAINIKNNSIGIILDASTNTQSIQTGTIINKDDTTQTITVITYYPYDYIINNLHSIDLIFDDNLKSIDSTLYTIENNSIKYQIKGLLGFKAKINDSIIYQKLTKAKIKLNSNLGFDYSKVNKVFTYSYSYLFKLFQDGYFSYATNDLNSFYNQRIIKSYLITSIPFNFIGSPGSGVYDSECNLIGINFSKKRVQISGDKLNPFDRITYGFSIDFINEFITQNNLI